MALKDGPEPHKKTQQKRKKRMRASLQTAVCCSSSNLVYEAFYAVPIDIY